MRLRKTRFSDIVWFLYGITVLTFSALIFTESAGFFFLDKGMGLLFTAAFFLISTGLIILRYYLQKKKPAEKDAKSGTKVMNILTFVFAFVCLAAGVILRLRQMQSALITPSLTGSACEDIYNSIFYSISALFGGNLGTIIVFNTVLTIISSVCLFFAMRKILGNFAAVLSVCFAFVSPYFCSFGLDRGPELLSLVFDMLALLFLSLLLPGRKAKIGIAIACGLFVGLSAFTDFSAISFLLAIPMFFIRDKEEKEDTKNRAFINAVLYIVGTVFGICLGALALSGIRGKLFTDELFGFVSGIRFFSNKVHIFASTDLAGLSIVALLLIPGIAEGYALRKKDQGTTVALLLIGFCVLDSLGLSGNNGSCEMMAVLLFAGMAGNLFDMFIYKEAPEETETIPEVLEEIEIKDEETEKTEETEETEKAATDPLENPLPVPKKKERGQVDYDYDVADNADYDI
ncbi:MAG: glycosyltransferase family 39 protein [Lachnospiraceae bacterium]|nr:glycosyltransferase family 39 protein [Lachnospiraceae bacterium]